MSLFGLNAWSFSSPGGRIFLGRRGGDAPGGGAREGCRHLRLAGSLGLFGNVREIIACDGLFAMWLSHSSIHSGYLTMR